jgi:hypothetical protein
MRVIDESRGEPRDDMSGKEVEKFEVFGKSWGLLVRTLDASLYVPACTVPTS